MKNLYLVGCLAQERGLQPASWTPDFSPARILTPNPLSIGMERGPGEGFTLFTCHRSEIYSSQPIPTKQASYAATGLDVAHHLFRVCSGLESPVLGETEILAQVKTAWVSAREHGTIGSTFDLLLRHALKASKRVRTETDLCRGVTSYAALAVREAAGRLGGMKGKRVVIIGAGQLAERVVKELRRTPPESVIVVNRTEANAHRLANDYGHQSKPLHQLPELLTETDLVIACTKGVIASAPKRPTVAVDLGSPPSLSPTFEAILLSDIVARCARNAEQRAEAIPLARAIIAEEVEAFAREWGRREEYGRIALGNSR